MYASKHHGWAEQVTGVSRIRTYVAESNHKAATRDPRENQGAETLEVQEEEGAREPADRQRGRSVIQTCNSGMKLLQTCNSGMKLPITGSIRGVFLRCIY